MRAAERTRSRAEVAAVGIGRQCSPWSLVHNEVPCAYHDDAFVGAHRTAEDKVRVPVPPCAHDDASLAMFRVPNDLTELKTELFVWLFHRGALPFCRHVGVAKVVSTKRAGREPAGRPTQK